MCTLGLTLDSRGVIALTSNDIVTDVTMWPTPPPSLRAGVGQGDFWKVGFEVVSLVERYARIRPDDDVLDVGCGLGRIAYLLAPLLETGSYVGLDNVPEYIRWCSTELGLDPGRFRFTFVDVYSSMYNPSGSVAPATVRFPWADGTFSLAIASSLFTHLSAEGTANYLNEIRRTLITGGRLFSSFFVLDEVSRAAIASGPTEPRLTAGASHGLVSEASNPDAAIAFDADWLKEVFTMAGYVLEVYQPGTWRRGEGPTHQDIVVARRA